MGKKTGRRRPPGEWRRILDGAADRSLSMAQLARQLNVSAATVRLQTALHGVQLVRGASARKHLDWLAELATAERLGLSRVALADRLGVDTTSVSRAIKKYGITLTNGKGGGPACRDWKSAFDKALAAGETQSALARRLGLCRQTVSLAAKRMGIQLVDGRAGRS